MENRHVALLIETSREYGRGLLRGLSNTRTTMVSGRCISSPMGWGTRRRAGCGRGEATASWCVINDRRMAKAVLQTGIPTVDLRGAVGDVGLPMIGLDNNKVVRLAAEHFLDAGSATSRSAALRGERTAIRT